MKNSLKILLFYLLAFITSCNNGGSENFEEFKFVVYDRKNEKLTIQNKDLSTNEIMSVISVLAYYQQPFNFKDGKLYIEKSNYKDKDKLELLWNYSTKSNDIEWLREHICR